MPTQKAPAQSGRGHNLVPDTAAGSKNFRRAMLIMKQRYICVEDTSLVDSRPRSDLPIRISEEFHGPPGDINFGPCDITRRRRETRAGALRECDRPQGHGPRQWKGR